jgi:hypothetical protein
MLLNDTEGFFYVLEPNLGASVATIIYSRPGETPVGIRSTLGLLNDDKFQHIPDDLKLSSEKLRFVAISVKGRCQVTAQTDEDMKWAVGEVGEELQTCSVYFTVISGCLQRQEPALSKKYRQAAQRLGLLGATSKQSAGVSQEAYLAFSDVLFKDMKKSMGESCTNIAVLLKKYMSFCQRLSQDADPRVKE